MYDSEWRIAIRTKALLAVFCLVGALAGCTLAPATQSERPAAAPSSDTAPRPAVSNEDKGHPSWLEGVVFSETSGGKSFIRVGSSAGSVGAGDRFAVTDDGTLAAVLQGSSLAIYRITEGTEVRRVGAVTWFAWRSGTHDLLYIARSPQTGKLEWHMYRPDGTDKVIGEGTSTATLSPTGRWFVTVRRPADNWELVAIALDSLHTVTVPGSQQGFSELKWAGPDTVAFIQAGKRVSLVALPSGHITTFLEVQGGLSGPMHWASDGSRLALPVGNGRVQVWASQGLLGECSGDWKPLGWSASGRYLALEERRSESVVMIDTQRMGECVSVSIPGKWKRWVEWHSKLDAVAMSVIPKDGATEEVQVWNFSSGKPELTVIGAGTRPSWLHRNGD
jgi:hypothetical protein